MACALAGAVCVGASGQKPTDAAPVLKGLVPGWTGLVDPSGRCRVSVPPQWSVVDRARMAFAPDGGASASEEWTPSPSWTWYKTRLHHLVRTLVQHEDSGDRLWLEYASGWDGVHHYAAVPSGEGVCVLQLEVRAVSAARLDGVVRQVVGSLIALSP